MFSKASESHSLSKVRMSLQCCSPTGARYVVTMQVPYLGQRLVDEKGKAGPYHWLSYAEVSKTRTEIGSGLLHYGMKSGSTLGLYSVNCRGACPSYSMECVCLSSQVLVRQGHLIQQLGKQD